MAGAASLPRKAPGKSLRSDPRPRAVDGVNTGTKLKNRDPDREYVWVYEAPNDVGVDHYLSLGYDIEKWRPEGVQTISRSDQRHEGDLIKFRGHILMSCTKEQKEELELHGSDGVSGQAEADEIERRIVRKRGLQDLLRGIGGIQSRDGSAVIGVENITQEPTAEISI